MSGDRYLRHSLIDWFSQEHIKSSRVAVVGAGAVGNEVIKNLALLGVGNIDIYDFDSIEIHNLTRSVLFRETDLNQNKADVARDRARDLDNSLNINSFHGDVWETLKISKLVNYNCIISCVDNFEARLKLNTLCQLYNIDFVNTGIDSRYVSIEVFPFGVANEIACYECNLPNSVYDKIQDRYSCGWLKRASYHEKKIPTTIITSSIAGSIATSCALRLGNTNTANRSFKILYDTINNTMSKTDYIKSSDCIICNIPNNKVFLKSDKSVVNSLGEITIDNDLSIMTSDQIIVKAVCNICNKDFNEYTYQNTRKISDSIMICDTCNLKSVAVDIRDSFSYEQFTELTKSGALDAKYIYFRLDDMMYIINTEED